MDLSERGLEDLYRTDVTNGRDKNRAIVSTVMYFRLPKLQGIF